MKAKVKFTAKKYKWGYSLWIEIDSRKILLASKLQTTNDVLDYISNDVSGGHVDFK